MCTVFRAYRGLSCTNRVLIGRVVDDEEPIGLQAEVQPPQTLGTGGIGDDQLAIGMAAFGRHLSSAASRVDPHDRRTGEGGTAQPEHEVRHVVEEDADMDGAFIWERAA